MRRRRIVQLAALAALGGAVSAAARAGQAVAPNARILRRAVSEPASLDPLRYGSANDFSIVADLFVGLTAFGADGRIVPGCAAHWRASDDGLRWTFRLRPGLEWSDGRPLTALDFVESARKFVDPATASLLAFRFRAIRNATEIQTGRAAPDSLGVSAPDRDTVLLALEHPQIDLPTLLTVLLPSPPPARPGDASAWVSNGPFLLKRRVVGDRIVLVRNPRFFESRTVRLDQVELVVAEAAQALPRFRAGEIDIARVTPEGVAWARRHSPASLRESAPRSCAFVLFNAGRPPFDDTRVRRALSMAIDREVLARQVRSGDALAAYSFLAPTTLDYVPSPGPVWRSWDEARRLSAARELLAAAGHDAAKPLRLELAFIGGALERREALALTAMWRRIGVLAEPRSSDARTLYGRIDRGQFEVASTALAPLLPGPMIPFEVLESVRARRLGGWSNSEFDSLVDRARRASTLEGRNALLRRAETVVLEEQPIAPLVFPTWQELVSPRVADFPLNLTSVRQSRWLSVVTPSAARA